MESTENSSDGSSSKNAASAMSAATDDAPSPITKSGASSKIATDESSTAQIPESNSPEVGEIDRLINETIDGYELRPSRMATDGEWCRRLYLDVIGRTPTNREVEQFLADRSKDKKYRLAKQLIYDPTYAVEFARQMTTVWTNVLIGRTGGTENNSLVSRAGMQDWLRDAFLNAKPYDEMVRELLTATGASSPEADEFNGAVNFLIDKVREDQATLATADTTRIFLGQQVQCVQCHNHPFNDWKQDAFWQMNAFFRQTRARRGDMRVRDGGIATLDDEDFLGESRRGRRTRATMPTSAAGRDDAEIFFELRNGLLKVAYPVFIDGTEINRSGSLDVVNRRERLADLVTQSPWMSKALVNRMWAHFLGYGFTSPVDNLGPHNPPSHPELLEYLAERFRSSQFDMRALMMWIVQSEAYGRSSQTVTQNRTDDPALGEMPKFTHFYLRQMTPEQLYESLLMTAQGNYADGDYQAQERQKSRWLQQFNQAFGNDEGLESNSFNGTITQTLMMFNGDIIQKAVRYDEGSMIDGLIKGERSDKKCVEQLYLAGLARKPTSNEWSMAKMLIASNGGNRHLAYQDLWWAILNSNEFILNH